MRTPFLTLIAAIGLITFAAARPICAQQPPASAAQASASSGPVDEAKRRSEVIVTGDRAEFQTKITGFVNQLTDFEYGDSNRGLARWLDPVCPLVTGLPRDMAEYILLRVSEIARAVGAPLGGEKCHTRNLFIIVSTHPEVDLRELDKLRHSEIFGDAEPILTDEFITTPRPVRTWYDTVEKTPEGLPMLKMSFPGISETTETPGRGGGSQVTAVQSSSSDTYTFLTNTWSQASHLVLNVVWAIQRVYVVVDPTKFKGVKLGQLADYVSMAGLAQIKLDPHLDGDPTILTLFDAAPEAASPGLTDWDQAFLKSVYAAEQKSVLARSAIAQEMVRTIAP